MYKCQMAQKKSNGCKRYIGTWSAPDLLPRWSLLLQRRFALHPRTVPMESYGISLLRYFMNVGSDCWFKKNKQLMTYQVKPWQSNRQYGIVNTTSSEISCEALLQISGVGQLIGRTCFSHIICEGTCITCLSKSKASTSHETKECVRVRQSFSLQFWIPLSLLCFPLCSWTLRGNFIVFLLLLSMRQTWRSLRVTWKYVVNLVRYTLWFYDL